MLKSKADLLKEGRPAIRASKGDETFTQVFLTRAGCELRAAELRRQGYVVEIIQ